jgi:hypothetical protein
MIAGFEARPLPLLPSGRHVPPEQEHPDHARAGIARPRKLEISTCSIERLRREKGRLEWAASLGACYGKGQSADDENERRPEHHVRT